MMRIQMLKIPLFIAAVLAASAGPAAAQGSSTPAAPDTAGLGASLDEHMRRLVPFGFNGVLLVVRDGRTVVRGGYGLADRESGRAFTPGTPFYIGSLTKQFTAAGILKLEMEGRLRVTDSIGRFFPNVPQDKRGITLHHLMTHTAGFGADPPAGLEAVRDRDAVVRDILDAPLRRAPGEAHAYSNAGYTLLGAVVEQAAGMPYERYLRENLWAPAGMASTGYRPEGKQGVAVGYRGGARWGNPLERHVFPDGPTWSLRGAGGMISTLDDLYAWSRALDGESVLSAEAKRKLWTPHVPDGPDSRSHYGYGWVVTRTSRGTGLVWHNGSNGIYYAELRRYPDENVLVIAASNVAEAMAEHALPGVSRLTFGMPYTPPPAAGPADPARAAAAAGAYRLAGGGTITAAVEGGELRLAADGADAFAAVRGSAPSPETQAVGERTVAVLRAASRGDFAPLHQALGGEMPMDALRRMYEDNMDAEGVGAVRAVEHVGTLARPGGARSIVRLRGERRDLLLALAWRGEGLTGMEPVQDAGPSRFVPADDGGWVSYDLPTGTAVRLRIQDGVMRIETPAGPVRATRA